MRVFGSTLFLIALAGLVLSCSGGTNEVELVAVSNGEDPGPKAPPGRLNGSTPEANGEIGTLAALCVQFCSHLRAADCKGDPAYSVADCPTECGAAATSSVPSTGKSSPECDDELAALYRCGMNAGVTCSAAGKAQVTTCEPQEDAYTSCKEHGSTSGYPNCVANPSGDSACIAITGQSGYHLYACATTFAPSSSCVQYTSTSFCCP